MHTDAAVNLQLPDLMSDADVWTPQWIPNRGKSPALAFDHSRGVWCWVHGVVWAFIVKWMYVKSVFSFLDADHTHKKKIQSLSIVQRLSSFQAHAAVKYVSCVTCRLWGWVQCPHTASFISMRPLHRHGRIIGQNPAQFATNAIRQCTALTNQIRASTQ